MFHNMVTFLADVKRGTHQLGFKRSIILVPYARFWLSALTGCLYTQGLSNLMLKVLFRLSG